METRFTVCPALRGTQLIILCSPPSPVPLSSVSPLPLSLPLNLARPRSLRPHSSLNSVNSSDSRSSGSHTHSPSSHYRYRSSNLAQQAPVRLSSVSSHDSGFISQDAFQSKSPSPMPPEAPNQVRVPLAPAVAVVPGPPSLAGCEERCWFRQTPVLSTQETSGLISHL